MKSFCTCNSEDDSEIELKDNIIIICILITLPFVRPLAVLERESEKHLATALRVITSYHFLNNSGLIVKHSELKPQKPGSNNSPGPFYVCICSVEGFLRI